VAAWSFGVGPVWAYIDPGTGGAFFSAVGPILAAAGVILLTAIAWGRTYVLAGARAVWRFWRWAVLGLVIAAAGLLCLLLLR